MRSALAAVMLALACAAALPARAALFDDDEARRRIDDLRSRVDSLDRSMATRIDQLESTVRSQGLVDLLRDIGEIKSDLSKLRGQYEVLTYELEQAQKRQRDLYVDLDTRLRAIESPASAAAPPQADAAPGVSGTLAPGATPGSTAEAPRASAPPTLANAESGARTADAAGEQRAYDAALDQFKSGNYAGAATAFTSFVSAYPKSPLASSALYWAGNAQYALRDYRKAIATQRQLLATYPDSQKAPDALLNIASSQVELGDTAGARRTLEDIVARHPGTDAANKARQRLAGGR